MKSCSKDYLVSFIRDAYESVQTPNGKWCNVHKPNAVERTVQSALEFLDWQQIIREAKILVSYYDENVAGKDPRNWVEIWISKAGGAECCLRLR